MKYTKSTCEKYTLKFNKGWDYAVITIDDTGIFQCHSSFGNFSYHWTSFGKSFKKFLCDINSDYILNKVSNQDYFNGSKYSKKTKNAIIELRTKHEIEKEEARELWGFIENIDENGMSYDLVCKEVYENSLLNKIYRGDVFYSPFAPEKDYSPRAIAFAENIFPAFVKILKEELKEETCEDV